MSKIASCPVLLISIVMLAPLSNEVTDLVGNWVCIDISFCLKPGLYGNFDRDQCLVRNQIHTEFSVIKRYVVESSRVALIR
jgi:hypothetical protein